MSDKRLEEEISTLKKQLAAEKKKSQALLPGMELVRLTELKYRFATIRARFPESREYSNGWCLGRAGAVGTKATLRANAARYMKDPDIKKVIEESRARQAEALELDGDKVIADILELKEMCMGRLPRPQSMIDDEGKVHIIRTYSVDAANAKGSLDLLGKTQGIFKESLELSAKDGIPLGVSREVVYVTAASMVNTGEAENDEEGTSADS